MFGRRAWTLVLVGLNGLLLWLLYPAIATLVYNNVGSVRLNRALLQPDQSAEERLAKATQAGQSFQTALAWDPLNGLAFYNLGTLYDFWGDSPSAFRAWSRSAALNPSDPSARFAFGQTLAAYEHEERARQEWKAAGAALYFVNQGLTLAQGGDHAGALEQYQRALAIAPDLVEGHYHAGRALLALGQEEEALAALELAAALEPASSPRRYLLQAQVHVARKEWTAALAAYRRAADLTPQDPVPPYRMGWVMDQKLGDQEAAIARFQWSLELDPDYAPPRMELGRLYVERGDCDRAALWLAPLLPPEAGVELSSRLHRLLGNCLLQQGRGREALTHLEQALALSPQSVEAHIALAQAYVQVQRYHEAIEVYLQVLELQPDNPQAQQSLEELGWFEAVDEGP